MEGVSAQPHAAGLTAIAVGPSRKSRVLKREQNTCIGNIADPANFYWSLINELLELCAAPQRLSSQLHKAGEGSSSKSKKPAQCWQSLTKTWKSCRVGELLDMSLFRWHTRKPEHRMDTQCMSTHLRSWNTKPNMNETQVTGRSRYQNHQSPGSRLSQCNKPHR